MKSLSEFLDGESHLPGRPDIKTRQVQPIVATIQQLAIAPKRKSNVRKVFVVPDIQCGFRRDLRTGALDPLHDRKALDVALQLCADINPDQIVFLGDNLDLPEWSLKFTREPGFYWTTQVSAVELAWWLAQFRCTVDAKVPVDYIDGNHEFRVSKLIAENALAAFDLRQAFNLETAPLLSVPALLGLDSLGITYHGPYPSGEVWLGDKIRLHHGQVVNAKSGGTVRSIVDSILHTEGQGHIHRFELAARTSWTASGVHVNIAFSPGTLARIDPGVVPGVSHRPNWQQGVAVVEYELDGPAVHVDMIPIHCGRSVYYGKIYEARNEAALVSRIEKEMKFKVSTWNSTP